MKILRKITLVISCIIICNASVKAQAKNIISPSDIYIQYMGRIDFSNPEKPLFAYPNVTIKAKFEGTSIDVMIQNYKGSSFSANYFVSIIDGGTPIKFIVTSEQQIYSIAQNLSAGQHTIEIVKVTESYCGECEFLGFQIDNSAKLLPPEALPDLKIEFIGNSITCGYGIEGSGQPQPACDNSYKAYAAVTAKQLNAQFYTTSYSGIGVVSGFAPFLMRQMYNRTIAITTYKPFPLNNIWDSTKFIPDIIVIALGTNDYNTGLKNGTITVDAFKSGYADLVSQIRMVYPNAHIICTNSPMVTDPKLNVNISTVVTDFINTGDKKMHYFSFSYMSGGGYNWHPGVEDGQTNAKQLADYIRTILSSTSISDVRVNKDNLSIFPNPAQKYINIKSTVNTDFIEISDMSGMIIKRIKVSLPGEVNMDISQLNKGIYILSTIDENNLKITKKICKL